MPLLVYGHCFFSFHRRWDGISPTFFLHVGKSAKSCGNKLTTNARFYADEEREKLVDDHLSHAKKAAEGHGHSAVF